ncbi:lipopolysaccharide biosynthesis protein [Francisella frigiditurris]|uniref:Polysaccharide biosynthesis family protein n=1 Tax=Francisella frigiditurris TaxID=1542390 RepID=A0A1J0KUQ9_9GAMM|nr:lipopolysaccharide biosynthesis protein [Francisella frigiditurris]APC97364.1 polysaccharide biosynthesis family protein [Francisella frigiditurris]
MKKNIFLYACSIALNRGSLLLFFPFLAASFSLSSFGKWNLIIIVANLLMPILTLNGSSSILREGSLDICKGNYLLKKYLLFTTVLNVTLLFILFVFFSTSWIIYSVLIGFLEGIIYLIITYYRVLDKAFIYFFINLLKILVLFLVILYVTIYQTTLYVLLVYYILALLLFVVFVIIHLFIKNNIDYKQTSVEKALKFSILLIPHGISQWIMSSSDRVIIEYVLGSAMLGVYSLAFSISAGLMLINSAIILIVPTYMIKSYDMWKTRLYDKKIIKIYTLVSICLFFIILLICSVDNKFTHILKYYNRNMVMIIYFIYFGIYLLGLYYFYANYLFFHAKAYIISKTTFYTAILNIMLTCLFAYILGVLGAAIATFISYICYLFLIRRECLKIEKNITFNLARSIMIFTICITIVGGIFYYEI